MVLLLLPMLAQAQALPSDPVAEDWYRDRVERTFAPAERDAIEAYRHAYATIDSAEDLARVRGLARELAVRLDPVIQAIHREDGNVGWLRPLLPGLTPVFYGGGASVAWRLDPAGFLAAAARTPERVDDVYLALEILAYGPGNVPQWTVHGCTALGSGRHLEVLQAADAALSEGELFAVRIRSIRGEVLEDIVAPVRAACDADDAGRRELRSILRRTRLAKPERRALRRRMREIG